MATSDKNLEETRETFSPSMMSLLYKKVLISSDLKTKFCFIYFSIKKVRLGFYYLVYLRIHFGILNKYQPMVTLKLSEKSKTPDRHFKVVYR